MHVYFLCSKHFLPLRTASLAESLNLYDWFKLSSTQQLRRTIRQLAAFVARDDDFIFAMIEVYGYLLQRCLLHRPVMIGGNISDQNHKCCASL